MIDGSTTNEPDSPVYHSEAVGLNFKVKIDLSGLPRVVFEDGINYRHYEIELLKQAPDLSLALVHQVKKAFSDGHGTASVVEVRKAK